jgi:hypothetical protein
MVAMSSQNELNTRISSYRRPAILAGVLLLMGASGCSSGQEQATTGTATAGTTAASPSSSANSTGKTTAFAPPSSVGDQVSGTAGAVPDKFPEAVPLPSQAPVVAFSNTSGEAKTFDLTYTSSDLDALVADIKQRLTGAGFNLSGEYNSKVKGVPSAGFIARSSEWIVNVGGTFASGQASVHLSVISA